MHIKRLFAGAARLVSPHLPFQSFSGGLLGVPFAFALLLATAAPLVTGADSYPYYRYRAESVRADGSQTDFVYSQSSCRSCLGIAVLRGRGSHFG
jgi:hypothetical protein